MTVPDVSPKPGASPGIAGAPGPRGARPINRRGAFRVAFALLIIGCAALKPLPHPRAALRRIVAAGRAVRTLRAEFVCEKKLAVLKKPFDSAGYVALERPGRVRLSTLRPYRSEFILRGNRVLARAQGQRRWHGMQVKRRPGLREIMRQLGALSLGKTAAFTRNYRVQVFRIKPPAPPRAALFKGISAAHRRPLEMFLLRPSDRAVARVLRRMRLGFQARTHVLLFASIRTAGGDVTRYWFFHVRKNVPLAHALFFPRHT